MKLRQFNESLERLGDGYLTEANDNLQQEIQKRYTYLDRILKQICKNLSQVSSTDAKTLSYNSELLKWTAALAEHLSRVASSSDPKLNLQYVDKYTKQIATSLKSGKLMYESLLESMNRTFGRLL